MLFLCSFSYAYMQQSLPLIVCFMLEVGGPSWCHRVQRAEPERGPLLAAGARVVPVPQIHRLRTGKRNGTGQKAQLTKLNGLACRCSTVLRPNASFRTLIVSYVSGATQNQERRWKNMELLRRESWFWLGHALFLLGREVKWDLQRPNLHQNCVSCFFFFTF